MQGLLQPTPHIAPKFLYDALGSPCSKPSPNSPSTTRHAPRPPSSRPRFDAMAEAAGPIGTLIDLGAGNCGKAAQLFPALRPQRYVAVDISVDFVRDALAQCSAQNPQLDMLGVGPGLFNPAGFPPGRCTGGLCSIRARASATSRPKRRSPSWARCEQRPRRWLLIGVDLVKRQRCSSRLRRRAGRDRGLQPQPAAPPQSPDRQRLPAARVAPRGLLQRGQSRIEMHLEARCDLHVVARRRAPRRGRAHAHRKLLQVQRRRASPPCCAAPATPTHAAGPTRRVSSRCSWPTDGCGQGGVAPPAALGRAGGPRAGGAGADAGTGLHAVCGQCAAAAAALAQRTAAQRIRRRQAPRPGLRRLPAAGAAAVRRAAGQDGAVGARWHRPRLSTARRSAVAAVAAVAVAVAANAGRLRRAGRRGLALQPFQPQWLGAAAGRGRALQPLVSHDARQACRPRAAGARVDRFALFDAVRWRARCMHAASTSPCCACPATARCRR